MTTGDSQIARVWDLKGAELATVRSKSSAVKVIRFSGDGSHFTTGGTLEKSFEIWNSNSGNLIQEWKDENYIDTISLNHNGTLAFVGWFRRGKFSDIAAGKIRKTLEFQADKLSSAIFTSAGDRLVIGHEKAVETFGVKTGAFLFTIPELDYEANVGYLAALSPDDTRVVLLQNKSAVIRNLTDGNLVSRLTGHTRDINSAAFSPDGRLVVTGSKDLTVRVWDVTTGRLLHTLVGHEGNVLTASFIDGGARILSVCAENTAKIWRIVEVGDLKEPAKK